jgi:hypothetical protein
MGKDKSSEDQIVGRITGPVQGQVAIGKEIRQRQSVARMGMEVTAAEMAELRQAFGGLREQVAAQAPPEKQQAALERVEELEEAVTADEPDLTTIQYVKRWFSKNLPELAGAVVSVVVHPIVGKIVEAAGEMAADQFKRLVNAD